jgi:hypothetical protein
MNNECTEKCDIFCTQKQNKWTKYCLIWTITYLGQYITITLTSNKQTKKHLTTTPQIAPYQHIKTVLVKLISRSISRTQSLIIGISPSARGNHKTRLINTNIHIFQFYYTRKQIWHKWEPGSDTLRNSADASKTSARWSNCSNCQNLNNNTKMYWCTKLCDDMKCGPHVSDRKPKSYRQGRKNTNSNW